MDQGIGFWTLQLFTNNWHTRDVNPRWRSYKYEIIDVVKTCMGRCSIHFVLMSVYMLVFVSEERTMLCI